MVQCALSHGSQFFAMQVNLVSKSKVAWAGGIFVWMWMPFSKPDLKQLSWSQSSHCTSKQLCGSCHCLVLLLTTSGCILSIFSLVFFNALSDKATIYSQKGFLWWNRRRLKIEIQGGVDTKKGTQKCLKACSSTIATLWTTAQSAVAPGCWLQVCRPRWGTWVLQSACQCGINAFP